MFFVREMFAEDSEQNYGSADRVVARRVGNQPATAE